MIFLQATPLSQNFWVAVLEALLLLALAAYIGWWIARRTLAAQIDGLHASIRAKRGELDDCRRTKVAVPTARMAASVAAAAPAVAAFAAAAPTTPDDLKVVEGIGPKIEELLNDEGIMTFAQLAATSAGRIKEILDAAGPRFQIHDPATWPEQSALARDSKWDELKKWQDELYKGRLD
jgi:predicted flap endonuclease-1-like 5' DNA nuclease